MGKAKKGWRMLAPVVLVRYWIFQGTLYMNRAELLHRAIIEAVFLAIAWFALHNVETQAWRLAGAMFAAHTASMIFNGHIFALFKHDLYWFGFYKRWDDFADYVEAMRERLRCRPCPSLKRAAIFGSITRGNFSNISDLDVRFVAGEGLLDGLAVAQRVFEERLRALIAGFPLDLYMVQSQEELARKINLKAEQPLILFDFRHRSYPVRFHDAARPRMEVCHG